LDNHAQQQRWLWQAVDHATGEVLAYVLNTHEDRAFLELKALLQPNGIQHFYTDGWGTYERHIDENNTPLVNVIPKRLSGNI
jgi:insertion element IS1 protein InsB